MRLKTKVTKPRGLDSLTGWAAREIWNFARAAQDTRNLTSWYWNPRLGMYARGLKPEFLNNTRYRLLRLADLRNPHPVALHEPRMMKKLWRALFADNPPPADRAQRWQQAGGGSNRGSGEWRAREVQRLLPLLRAEHSNQKAWPEYKLHNLLGKKFGVSRTTILRDIDRQIPT